MIPKVRRGIFGCAVDEGRRMSVLGLRSDSVSSGRSALWLGFPRALTSYVFRINQTVTRHALITRTNACAPARGCLGTCLQHGRHLILLAARKLPCFLPPVFVPSPPSKPDQYTQTLWSGWRRSAWGGATFYRFTTSRLLIHVRSRGGEDEEPAYLTEEESLSASVRKNRRRWYDAR